MAQDIRVLHRIHLPLIYLIKAGTAIEKQVLLFLAQLVVIYLLRAKNLEPLLKCVKDAEDLIVEVLHLGVLVFHVVSLQDQFAYGVVELLTGNNHRYVRVVLFCLEFIDFLFDDGVALLQLLYELFVDGL